MRRFFSNDITVFTRFVARALIFFQPYSLQGPYSNGRLFKHGRLVIFKVKLLQKLSLKTNISRHLIFLHMIYSRQTQINTIILMNINTIILMNINTKT